MIKGVSDPKEHERGRTTQRREEPGNKHEAVPIEGVGGRGRERKSTTFVQFPGEGEELSPGWQ